MTLPSLWSPPVAADEDETKWSFLRQLILAIAAERQKKADEIVREYQQRQAESSRTSRKRRPSRSELSDGVPDAALKFGFEAPSPRTSPR